MRCFLYVVLILSTFPSYVIAESSYHSELIVNYDQFKANNSNSSFNYESNNKTVGYKYYFSSVNTKNHPLREAAFLEKASSVFSSFSSMKVDIEELNFNYTTDSYRVEFDYVIHNSSLPVSLSAGYADFQSKSELSGSNFLDYNLKTTGIGAYLGDRTKISFAYSEFELVGETDKMYDINIKSVIKTGSISSLSLFSSIVRVNAQGFENYEFYVFDATYYVNPRIGLGATLRGDSDGETRNVTLSADIFFSKQFAAKLGIGKLYDNNDSDFDSDMLQVSFTGRF